MHDKITCRFDSRIHLWLCHTHEIPHSIALSWSCHLVIWLASKSPNSLQLGKTLHYLSFDGSCHWLAPSHQNCRGEGAVVMLAAYLLNILLDHVTVLAVTRNMVALSLLRTRNWSLDVTAMALAKPKNDQKWLGTQKVYLLKSLSRQMRTYQSNHELLKILLTSSWEENCLHFPL